ncbi:ROK family protein [Halorussus litoreus]|uniref:ROK family protein n=1 Tax=Halorussus litoreus TaxID=1710536 RepID=UPI000E22A093|nr:ROK family protein [Halorussus litoreus]
METIAAFGIGSTNFRYAVGTPSGEFLTDVRSERTRANALASRVVRTVRALDRETPGSLSAVSVSCTGLVDHANGVVREFDTREGTSVRDVDLAGTVRRELDLPLFLENDCTAAALGEWRFGASDEYESVAHVTFGTGIGAGVVDRGRPVRGESGQAAEVGLFPVAPATGLDSFGVPGAWEAVCSGRGIPEFVARRLRNEERPTVLDGVEDLTAPDLFEAADDGDEVAEEYLEQIGRYNAAGIGTLCNAFNPGLITLGGGVALNNQRVVLDGIREHLDDFLYVDAPDVRTTDLGDDIGLYGALARGCDPVETGPTPDLGTEPR